MSAKLIPVEKMTKEQIEATHQGIRHLAAACDGAKDLDGQGFNKFDTEIGHSLASFSKLSSKQLKIAASLCYKYRKQFSGKLKDIIDGLKDSQTTLFI